MLTLGRPRPGWILSRPAVAFLGGRLKLEPGAISHRRAPACHDLPTWQFEAKPHTTARARTREELNEGSGDERRPARGLAAHR
jgi:hypothetical protein